PCAVQAHPPHRARHRAAQDDFRKDPPRAAPPSRARQQPRRRAARTGISRGGFSGAAEGAHGRVGARMNEVWKKPPVSLAAYQDMVGKEVGVSSWHLVNQPRIDDFADVIEDHQFIHVDPERARRETSFGTTVAHGFLTMSLLSIMSYEVMPVIEGTTMGVNYGFDKLRFISPVRAGSPVRGRFVLAEAKLRKPKELQSRTNVTVEIEGEDKPALVADWIGLIYFE